MSTKKKTDDVEENKEDSPVKVYDSNDSAEVSTDKPTTSGGGDASQVDKPAPGAPATVNPVSATISAISGGDDHSEPADDKQGGTDEDIAKKYEALKRENVRLKVAQEENVPVDLLPDSANENVLKDYVRRLNLYASATGKRSGGYVDPVQQAASSPKPKGVHDVTTSIFNILRNGK